jgi:hypothetical protein
LLDVAYPQEIAMEELNETQQYAARSFDGEDRRKSQQAYEGDDRRRQNPSIENPVRNPDGTNVPVSDHDGTGRR